MISPQRDPSGIHSSCRSAGWGVVVLASATEQRCARLSPRWQKPSSAHCQWKKEHGNCRQRAWFLMTKDDNGLLTYVEPNELGTTTSETLSVLSVSTTKSFTTGLGVPGCTWRKDTSGNPDDTINPIIATVKNNKTIWSWQSASGWTSYLWVGDGNSAGVLVLPVPAVLDVMDLSVIGLNVSHALPSRWPPEPLARWEHLLWKEVWCEGKCWCWQLLWRDSALTFIYPVWDPIKNCIFFASVSDLLWRSCRTDLYIQIVIPNKSLETQDVVRDLHLKEGMEANHSSVQPYQFVPHGGPGKVLDFTRNVRFQEFSKVKLQSSRFKTNASTFVWLTWTQS